MEIVFNGLYYYYMFNVDNKCSRQIVEGNGNFQVENVVFHVSISNMQQQ